MNSKSSDASELGFDIARCLAYFCVMRTKGLRLEEIVKIPHSALRRDFAGTYLTAGAAGETGVDFVGRNAEPPPRAPQIYHSAAPIIRIIYLKVVDRYICFFSCHGVAASSPRSALPRHSLGSTLQPLTTSPELIDKCVGSRIWVIMKGDRGTDDVLLFVRCAWS